MIEVTAPTQPPHWVPAPVHFFTAARSCAPPFTASRSVFLVTPLHEQITASSGSAAVVSTGPDSPAGSRKEAAGPGSWAPTRGRRVPYASASPTRMPPISCPSGPSTSFL